VLVSQLLRPRPERVRPDALAQPRRGLETSEANGSQSNSPDLLDPSTKLGRTRPPGFAAGRGAVLVIAGVIALGLVGLGVRATPTLPSDPGPGPLVAAPAPATESHSIAPETSPRPEPRRRPTPTMTAKPVHRGVQVKPVKAGSVPTTGPRSYDHAGKDGRPPSGGGTLIRYDVRVEANLDIDPDAAATFIAEVLNDQRSWRGSDRWRFQLVSSAAQATLHAYIVTPGTTDQLCAPLLTRGEVSCQNGNRVVLNAKRWLIGVDAYGDDVTGYRRYLVNHEFGHALGHGHVQCPGKGRRAPVMMQQTKGLGGCRQNPWPVGTDY
jgi:hypothetical protein